MQPLGQLQPFIPTLAQYQCQKDKGKSKKLETYLNNNERKLPKFGEGTRHASPGSTGSPKPDGFKEAHSKTHHT